MSGSWTLEGVWAAIPTPWMTSGGIDAGQVAELVARYKAHGINGVYTTGTDGEMHVLDLPEFKALVDAFAASTGASGIPAQVGCTWHHTDGVIERIRYARDRGIDHVQIALPSWVPLNDREMLSFFETIATALPDVRIIHYNIAKAGRFLTGRDYRAILNVTSNLIGSKHTGGDVGSIIEIAAATPELRHFVVDTQIVPGALFGAKGFYSFLVNLNPVFAAALWQDCVKGDWTEAARKRVLVDAFFRAWLADTGGISGSPALGKIATKAGIFPDVSLAVRAPYQSGTDAHVAQLRSLLDERFPELRFD
jgi:dihydrodipicolinate synthase/N-acetylneuraminate lyase